MNEQEIRLELETTKATLYLQNHGENRREIIFSYIKFPELRKLVVQFARQAVLQCERQLFRDLCTRCGNCCRTGTVPVTSREIYAIAEFLGFASADEMRELYIDPAVTWNSRDGIVRKNQNGCAFLQKGLSRFAVCSVYPVRPEHCADHTPGLPECRAELDLFIHHMDSILVSRAHALVMTKTGNQECLSLQGSPLLELAGAIERYLLMLENTRLSDYSRIREALESRLTELEAEYRCLGISRAFLAALEEVTSLAEGLHGCIEENRADIERICYRARRILLQIRGEYAEPGPIPAKSHAGSDMHCRISSASIWPRSLRFSIAREGQDAHYYVEYEKNQAVTERVRHLLMTIAKSDNEALIDALWHISAPCFKCGECCKSYRVEVTPMDVDRMASHFHMTNDAFRKKYLNPPAFSWNEGNAILAKIDSPPLDEHFNYSGCIFLRRMGSNAAYCSIYEARPDVCREYHASNLMCKRIHQMRRADSLVDNIISLDIEEETLVLVTKRTACQEPPQLRIDLREEKDIMESYTSLAEALAGHVSS